MWGGSYLEINADILTFRTLVHLFIKWNSLIHKHLVYVLVSWTTEIDITFFSWNPWLGERINNFFLLIVYVSQLSITITNIWYEQLLNRKDLFQLMVLEFSDHSLLLICFWSCDQWKSITKQSSLPYGKGAKDRTRRRLGSHSLFQILDLNDIKASHYSTSATNSLADQIFKT